ncbi:MAG: sigma-70 family RNA polymerase sigma factor [Chitinophagaceae bacterium]|nr:MAG: sigma-70 family RNA polymerase sigma factor [Chitinophagaceae bacterium]
MKETPTVPLSTSTDWIVRLKANDDLLLETIYKTGFPGIKKYIIQNNGTEDDAKDIYQEAFIIMWRNVQLDKISFRGFEQLQGYLYRIAQYKWLDHLRSSRVKHTSAMPDTEIETDMNSETDIEENAYIATVRQHYAAMGNPCKEVLKRFYFLKQSMAQIASNFSWTEATAKNNKYRCLQKLRNMILAQKNNSI